MSNPGIIDLSGMIEDGAWDYNVLDLGTVQLPPNSIRRVASVGADGFDAHGITFNTLSGTYLETAAHMVEGAPTLDQIALDRLSVPARIVRLGERAPRSMIGLDDLVAAEVQVNPGEALIIDTGWGRRWNTPGYVVDAPCFSVKTLQWFLDQPFSILGLDTPVMECQWDAPGDAGELLKPLYEQRSMLLLAPLVNLDAVPTDTGTLVTLPLSVQGVCSAPSRTVFLPGHTWPTPAGPTAI